VGDVIGGFVNDGAPLVYMARTMSWALTPAL
jgi:hypothetical protein